jgi:hypothetical protein
MAIGAFGGSLVQVGALLLVLVGALMLLGRRLRSAGAASSVRLTPQHAVHLVELGGRAFVVGTGPGAAPHMLIELPSPAKDGDASRGGATAEGSRLAG